MPPGIGQGALPLLVMLHGATGSWQRVLKRLGPIADHALVVLQYSLGQSWDVLEGGYGPDIRSIDAALRRVLAVWAIDGTRCAVARFSDGASYAVSLALMNGPLFTHCLAFSPGFAAPLKVAGRPAFCVSHGTADEILPIATCSRRLVPKLERSGYQHQYMEFPGQHEVPPDVQAAALAFLLAGDQAGLTYWCVPDG